MKIYCIRHVAFEGPGIIENWARDRGHDFNVVKPYEGELFPDESTMDALVIMGGPMGVNDTDKFSWLAEERLLIRTAIEREIPVLGICLGAQLLASVLGQPVFKNKFKEIGWFDVGLSTAGRQHPLTEFLPASFKTFHWHGDTFDLPEDAIHLASSTACRQQAFTYKNVLALQFHMEMTEDGIREVSERCASEFIEAPYIQSGNMLVNHPAMEDNHRNLKKILDRWSLGNTPK